MNGDVKSGVTIMKILPKHFDIGEVLALKLYVKFNRLSISNLQILAQKEVPISNDCLMPELYETLSKEGANLLVDCLHDLDSKLENAQQQMPDQITYGRL